MNANELADWARACCWLIGGLLATYNARANIGLMKSYRSLMGVTMLVLGINVSRMRQMIGSSI